MSTGDPFCHKCGRWFCYGECEIVKKDYELPQIISVPKNWGELKTMLGQYMGDEFFARVFADCIDLIKKKNADYSQGEQKGDRIAAFRRISKDYDIPMEKVWAVFTEKHIGAIRKYVKDGAVESEPVEGRISDIINYMVLLAAIIDDQKVGDE